MNIPSEFVHKQNYPNAPTHATTRHEAMVAFKIESWIWYAVVLLIAGSRLLVSQAHAHMHKARSTQAQSTTPFPSPLRLEYPASPKT